jgi:predicted transcriptional regulator
VPKKTAPPLGELEIAVLEHVWRVGDLTAKEAHEALGRSRGISLNTVQSTLDRLHRKQILTRKKEARAYRYAPRVAREALLAELIGDLVGRLGGGEPASSLAASAPVSIGSRTAYSKSEPSLAIVTTTPG